MTLSHKERNKKVFDGGRWWNVGVEVVDEGVLGVVRGLKKRGGSLGREREAKVLVSVDLKAPFEVLSLPA